MKNIQANKLRQIIYSVLFVLMFTSSFGQSIPDRPSPPRLVNDFANILSAKQVRALENKLVRFNDTTSNQITVIIVKSLEGFTPSMFATEIGLKWSVGQKGFDNGIVVLVKPKLSSRDRGRAYIAVGYGLEPAIPDAIAKRIVDNEMIPYFKQGDYYGGINQATNVLMQFAAGEINADGYGRKTATNGVFSILPFIIIIIIVIMIRKSSGGSHGIGGRSSNSSLWTALLIGSIMNSGSHSGSWGGFSGGSGGFGGGGFGGFGGGSFGGGGAGGSW
ncbi:MAG: TPM domain-containing protein [Bacteroidota bacterium]